MSPVRRLLALLGMRSWWAEPLRGRSLRERWRIMRLAQKGKKIEEREDAAAVDAFVRAELNPSQRAIRSGLWQALAVVALAGSLIWWGSILIPYFTPGLAIGPVLMLLPMLMWLRRKYRLTAKANGWHVDQPRRRGGYATAAPTEEDG